MSREYRIIAHVFEEGTLVVTHTFYGKTLREASVQMELHLARDEYLHSAITTGKWDNEKLNVKIIHETQDGLEP